MKLTKILKKFTKKRRKPNKKQDNLKEKGKKKELKLVENIIKFFGKHDKKIKKIYEFIVFVAAYGFLTNFMLWGIWKIKFSILSFLAYGILVYLIRDEFVLWIRKIIYRR